MALGALLVACSGGEHPTPQGAHGATEAAADDRATVVCFGTSLTAGLGLDPDDAYPALVQQRIDSAGLSYRVVNAGVSGATSADGLRRIDWVLREPLAVFVLELGANDALRGLDPAVTRSALSDILTRLKARNIAVMLCGMMAPPNYGRDYAERFNAIYPDLAKSFGVPLYPFFLDGVAADAKLNQADGIHPTPQGVDIIVNNIMPTVEAFLGPLRGQQP